MENQVSDEVVKLERNSRKAGRLMRLPRVESEILGYLMTRKRVGVEEMYELLYADRQDKPSLRSVPVHVSSLRRKHRVPVRTKRDGYQGKGYYYLDQETKSEVRQAIAMMIEGAGDKEA